MTTLSFTEGMMIAKAAAIRNHADEQMTLLEREIARLHRVIAEKDATIARQERRAKADACSIAGYRAYAESVRENCEAAHVDAAVDAYTQANDAKAMELGAPHLKKVKTVRTVKQAA